MLKTAYFFTKMEDIETKEKDEMQPQKHQAKPDASADGKTRTKT